LRQTADRFSVPGAPPAQAAPAAEEQPDAAYLYALNGRGGNQGADWIRLGGRVYAVYRDSRYGVDNIYLLRPWHGRGQVPRLVVRYRYALAVPVDQPGREGQATRLAPALHRALEQAAALAAARADTPPAQNRSARSRRTRRTKCATPIPAMVRDTTPSRSLRTCRCWSAPIATSGN